MDSGSDNESDLDSLFDEIPIIDDHDRSIAVTPPTSHASSIHADTLPAHITAPSIPGLYFDPTVSLPQEYANDLLHHCMNAYFSKGNVNQVMLFERVSHDFTSNPTAESTSSASASKLPAVLIDLLQFISHLLRPMLPEETYALLFPPQNAPPQARQVIINHYSPGEGITSHVDLLDRFGDGIIGVSMGSGCVMRFQKLSQDQVGLRSGYGTSQEENGEVEDVYLSSGSVYVMSKEARYGWTHGIEGRKADLVQIHPGDDVGEWVDRSIRVSITFRWLLPGADVVGGTPVADGDVSA